MDTRSRLIGKLCFALIVILSAVSLPAFAHKGATGIVKERMEGMSAMKDGMAVIGKMVTNKTAIDLKSAREAAKSISFHADEMRALFPDTKESRQKATQATGKVWTEQERFGELIEQLMLRSQSLENVIAAGEINDIKAAFGKVGKACSACHEDYRKPKG